MTIRFKDTRFAEMQCECTLDILKICSKVSRKLALNNEDITQEFAELYAACTPIKILEGWYTELYSDEKYDSKWFDEFLKTLKECDQEAGVVYPDSEYENNIPEHSYSPLELRFYEIMCKQPSEITIEEKHEAFKLLPSVFYYFARTS